MTVMTSTLPRRRGRFMLALPVLTLLLCVLAVVHLGDRIMGDGPFVTPWPGGERALTTAPPWPSGVMV